PELEHHQAHAEEDRRSARRLPPRQEGLQARGAGAARTRTSRDDAGRAGLAGRKHAAGARIAAYRCPAPGSPSREPRFGGLTRGTVALREGDVDPGTAP